MQFIQENWGAIAAALLAVSEVLAAIPAIKSNSVFQLLVELVKKLSPKKSEEPK
jgi:hypothetical protein